MKSLYLIAFWGCALLVAVVVAPLSGADGPLSAEEPAWVAAALLFVGFVWLYDKDRGTAVAREPRIWAIPVVAVACLLTILILGASGMSEISLVPGVVLVAIGEELVFRGAPLILLTHCGKLLRIVVTATVGILVFVAAHIPSFDILLVDKVCFAVTATILVIASGGIWLSALLHISSNLLWHAIGRQSNAAYFVVDILLLLVTSILALRFGVRKGSSIGVSG